MKSVFKSIGQSSFFSFVIKAGLTLLAFWFVFRGIDFEHLSDMLKRQDTGWLAVAVVVMIMQMVVGAMRWRLVLNAISDDTKAQLSRLRALKIYYISIFFMCCLPGTVGGDVVRVWLTKSETVPLPIAIHSVIIDRIIALVALASMIIFTLPVLGGLVGFDPALVLSGVVVLAVFGVWLLLNMERIIGRYRQFRIINWVLYFLDSLRLILRKRSASVQSFLIAVTTHSFYCMGAYFLAKSFDIQITLFQCITLVPPVLLATTIPISIGGWGIREAGTIGMLGLVGVPQAQALMLSIQLGIIIILTSLPASILWLMYRRHNPRRIDVETPVAGHST